MPPKKAAAAKAAAAATEADGETKFSWTPENERRLLLLAARSSIGGADYHEFIKAMPPGVSYEGLRQKFQKLRREQKEIYEKMGWTLNDSCPTTSTKGAEKTDKPEKVTKGKKRSADGDAAAEAEGDQAAEKPVKRPRSKGRPKKVAPAKEVDQHDGPTNDLSGLLKEEAVDGDV